MALGQGRQEVMQRLLEPGRNGRGSWFHGDELSVGFVHGSCGFIEVVQI